MHIHNSMILSVAGTPYAASKGGTRDAADQEIADRVNAAAKLNGENDRTVEITESRATGDRNPDGQLPLDQFDRSNQREDPSAVKEETSEHRGRSIQHPQDISTSSVPPDQQRLDFSA